MYNAETGTMSAHSLVHLHHMKTGGTSMDDLLKCTCKDQKSSTKCKSVKTTHLRLSLGCLHCAQVLISWSTSLLVVFVLDRLFELSECDEGSVEECYDSPSCNEYEHATLMSYCTSMYDIDRFGWNDARLVSTMRNPVDRVWSLYRFESRKVGKANKPPCFNCLPLADVYAMLDNGTIDEIPHTTEVCKRSLSNYMTQFFTDEALRGDAPLNYSVQNTPLAEQQQIMDAAFFNMWNRSALVLHTEDLSNGGFAMLQHMAPGLFGSPDQDADDLACTFQHDNASPDENACGATLAKEPDDETRRLIIEHNQLDNLLFKSSQRMYDMQKQLLLDETTR